MSTKQQLEEISAALSKASKLHKEQSGRLKGMAAKMKDDAKLEQFSKKKVKSKSVRKGHLTRVKTGESLGDKIKNVFTNKGDKGPTTNNPNEMTTNTTYGSRNESAADRYNEMTNLNQSRKVLTQVSTGGEAGVGQMGNFPTAPNFVPPMPPQGTLPPPPQTGMMNPNYPPVPQEGKDMPKGKEGRGIRMLSDDVQRKMGYNPLSQKREPNEFDKAAEFNKYAMQKGISPNFDSIKAADTTEYKQQHLEAMKKFYSNPANVRMMKREKEKYFKNK